MNAVPVDAFPYTQSYWMLGHPVRTSPPLEGEHDADVVIVGGGYAGMSTAFSLMEHRPDLRVTVLEAQHVGYGASGRNGGHIMNFPPVGWMLEDLSQPEKLAPVQMARGMAAAYVRTLAQALEREGIDAELEETGIGAVARNAFEVASIRWARDLMQSAGVETRWYEGDAARSRISYPAKAVMTLPTTVFHPFKLAQGLRTMLLRRGVTFFENTPATRIESTADGVVIETPHGKVRAGRAVVTTNAYILQSRLSLDVSLPKTTILHTYVVATDRLSDEDIHRICPNGEDFGDPAITFFYGRIHDRRLLFGGVDRRSRNTPQDDRRERSYRALHRELVRRFPFLSQTPLYAAWGGAVQETWDNAPIIQRAAPDSNIVLNMGFGGNSGVNGALFAGHLVPSLVLEQHDDADAQHILSLFQQSRIPWMGALRAGTGVLKALFRS